MKQSESFTMLLSIASIYTELQKIIILEKNEIIFRKRLARNKY